MARIEGLAKASGSQIYTGDVRPAGLLHGAVVRSPFPHARIVEIDTAAARALPGVAVVLTAADIAPGALAGRQVRDIPVLARERVRYVGEPVAAVAADSRARAEEAVRLIRVEYEQLPAVFDAEAALEAGAPVVHDAPWEYPGAAVHQGDPKNLQSRAVWSGGGDVEVALAASAHRIELTLETPFAHQGYIEPQSCVVAPEADGTLRVWAANKSPYKLRSQLATCLGLDEARIRVEPIALGGDFGGKGSPMDVPLCTALALAGGRPVRMVRRYAEDLMATNPRHAARMRVRIGCDAEGRLTAVDLRCVFNGGAYGGFKPMGNVNLHGPHGTASSYRVPAIRIESLIAYTHTVPGGHRRSPGAPQVTFAVESAIDDLARQIGIDPFEFRRRNLLRTGDANPLGEHWLEARGVETLDAAVAALRPLPVPAGRRRGVGMAIYDRPTPVGRTSLALRAEADGGVTVFVPIPETGTGAHTVVRAVVAHGLGIEPERVRLTHSSTSDLPHDEGVGGSRVTATMSVAARAAVDRFRELAPPVGERFVFNFEPEAGRHITSFSVQIAQVAVDQETGQIQVLELISAHDVAQVINPESHRVQIEGGAAMGFGYACLEDLRVDEGRVTAANLGDYKLPSQRDVPPINIVLVPGGRGVGEENVKAIGEMSNVPVAGAVANAVRDAVGVRLRRLPLSADQVWEALHPERR